MAVPVYYAMLGLPPGATAEEIERAFHAGIARCEPEAQGGDRLALQRYRALLEAHAVLGDPLRRAVYDLSLRHAGLTSQAADGVSGQPAVGARTDATGAAAEEPQASSRTQRLWRRMRRPLVWSTALAVVVGAAFGAGALRPPPRPMALVVGPRTTGPTAIPLFAGSLDAVVPTHAITPRALLIADPQRRDTVLRRENSRKALIVPAQSLARQPSTDAIHLPVPPGLATLPTHGTVSQNPPRPDKAGSVNPGDRASPPYSAVRQRHARLMVPQPVRHTDGVHSMSDTPNKQGTATPGDAESPPAPFLPVPLQRRAQAHGCRHAGCA